MDQLTDKEKYVIKRRRAKISLQELGEHCDCHYTFISKWERELRSMSPEMETAYKQYIDERQEQI